MTPTTPDHKPAPATDEEIADTFSRANRVTGIGSVRALKLIARIESDRARIAELEAQVEDLWHRNNEWTTDRATIAKQAEENNDLKQRIAVLESDRGKGCNPNRDPDHNDR